MYRFHFNHSGCKFHVNALVLIHCYYTGTKKNDTEQISVKRCLINMNYHLINRGKHVTTCSDTGMSIPFVGNMTSYVLFILCERVQMGGTSLFHEWCTT